QGAPEQVAARPEGDEQEHERAWLHGGPTSPAPDASARRLEGKLTHRADLVPSAVATRTVRRTTLGGLNLAFLLMAAHATNDAFTNVLPAFLPTLQLRVGVGEAMLATFVAVVSLSANVMQAFLGVLADRWGRRRSAALGLIGGSVLMSFIAVAPNAATLMAILAVGGLGSALFHPAAVSLVAGTGARRSLAVGLFAAGGPIGAALMPVVALAIIRNYGVQYVPWLAILGVVIGL